MKARAFVLICFLSCGQGISWSQSFAKIKPARTIKASKIGMALKQVTEESNDTCFEYTVKIYLHKDHEMENHIQYEDQHEDLWFSSPENLQKGQFQKHNKGRLIAYWPKLPKHKKNLLLSYKIFSKNHIDDSDFYNGMVFWKDDDSDRFFTSTKVAVMRINRLRTNSVKLVKLY
ncbi:MAG: hypothetical protein MRY83_22270 [Flavobacteriales bacterium]|nr:hypothetical protein [Flavobacteriales bacterium]